MPRMPSLSALIGLSLVSSSVLSEAASADEAWAWLAEHGVEVVATTPDTDVEHTDADLTGAVAVGVALVFAGVGSMLAAAVVLLAAARDKARAAVSQGVLPLIAIVLVVIGLVL